MQRQNNSDDNQKSINTSPRMCHKSGILFGLLTKRSTKVEPHPEHTIQDGGQHRSSSAGTIHANPELHDMQYVKAKLDETRKNSLCLVAENRTKQPKPEQYDHEQENKNRKFNAKVHMKSPYRLTTDGSQSDGDEVVLRKSNKRRSPNHNRFSHQFSLCCKTEKKPCTPPVTVRYNSVIDATQTAVLPSDNSSALSIADEKNTQAGPHKQMPTASMANAENIKTKSLSGSGAELTSANVLACSSAPESPVTVQGQYNAHSSPSNCSTKSTQSDIPNGPIRPIAVSACRSRLRLKLYPPGKDLPGLNMTAKDAENMFKPLASPQHMSSPNISTRPEFSLEDDTQHEVRFMSHENIQLQRQSSSCGLARQALMAAQVLSLIPTEKARERSFLDGRLGTSSLLGPTELNRVLPNKEVTIFVGTWNMNGQSPPKQMHDFVLPANVEHIPDIVAIGTQESSPDRFEWEVTLQETLGPSHVLFHSTTLGTLHLAIYLRRDLIWYCSAPEDANMSVRTGSAFRTKGAVAISFCLFGTSMLFVTSHLTAHQQKVKERVSDVKRITHALDLPRNLNLRHKNKDVTQNFDNVFWCGDLNFRLSEPREKLLEWIENTKFPLPSHLPHGYMHTDQLSSVLSDGAAFRGFMEANITFPPTYKYDPGTQHFDTSSKQRAPAYTDRILYKYRQSQGLMLRRQSTVANMATSTQPYVQCLLYDSVPSIITSDHKPVWALFKTVIRAGTDSIPLAAGLFSRDIYLEGMKRRLNNQYSGSSAVCIIQ